SFLFDSEASLDEGEQIIDNGAGASPRFVTGAVTQGYSPLDQYLMGLRPPAAVPPVFAVINSPYPATLHPQSGVTLSGDRLDISVNDIIASEGRRTPDSTVAQRRYRFAFLVVVPAGSTPPDSQLQQIETYRQQFPAFFAKAASNNASADVTLNRSMKFSLFPAAGVIAGGTAGATLTVQSAPKGDLTVQLQAPNGCAQAPASVKIAAGAMSANFAVNGVKGCVEELLATPSDATYETAFARVQVADGASLKLETVSGGVPGAVPTIVRLTDINGLPYPGVRLSATVDSGAATNVLTDVQGQASFNWTSGVLRVSAGAAGVSVTFGDPARPTIGAVVNAASSEPGISPGAIHTLYGARLPGGAQILLQGSLLPLLYASDTQITFYVPFGITLGKSTLVLQTQGVSIPVTVTVAEEQPGIFPGAILKSNTTVNATTTAVRAGDYIEIYCTGLGPTRTSNSLAITALTPTVFIGGVPVKPLFSGLAPGFTGLYQVDVRIPDGINAGLDAGPLGVILSVGSTHSNEAKILVQ
ncbi:MAG TPA: hypothetical protein VKE70_31605, partial [Candidatus Solibacter sp.]|nr:hypothetical protein [Candidatus Solibacter sp.]